MKQSMKKVLLGLGLAAASVSSFAATSDTTFSAIYTVLQDWATGTLGRVIAIAMFLVGLAAGIVRQSIMAVVAGIAAAATMAYGPGVIDGIFSATV